MSNTSIGLISSSKSFFATILCCSNNKRNSVMFFLENIANIWSKDNSDISIFSINLIRLSWNWSKFFDADEMQVSDKKPEENRIKKPQYKILYILTLIKDKILIAELTSVTNYKYKLSKSTHKIIVAIVGLQINLILKFKYIYFKIIII